MSQVDQERIKESIENSSDDGGDIGESLSQLLDDLADEEMDMLFSDLTEEEIKHLSVLESTGDELTKNFAKNFRNMKVSRKRKGRSELVEIANAFSGVFDKQEGSKLDQLKDKFSL